MKKTKLLGAAMSLAAAVSMTLLAVPSATAVDDPLDDTLAVSTTVEEATEDATPEAGDDMVLSGDAGISVRAYSGCPKGYACLWDETGYKGSRWKESNREARVANWMDNKSWSAAANGEGCARTFFYDEHTNAGAYFVLFSMNLVHDNYQDPDLSNGAGKGKAAGRNWANRVSFIKFDGCPN